MDRPLVRRYRFAGFEVDAARRQLFGPDGQPRPMSARAFDVLLHLVENAHRVVDKQELMAAVWPRSVVEENNLNQAISGARRALGDNREAARFILTVPGRGRGGFRCLQMHSRAFKTLEAQGVTVAPGADVSAARGGNHVAI